MPEPVSAQTALSRVFPNGARQGQKLKLTFAGADLPETATLLVDLPGIEPLGPFKKGEGEVQISPDAAPGVRFLRLAHAKGVTTPRPFAIGTLPELEEKEPNSSLDEAQRLESLPVTLNGVLPTRPDVDAFRVSLKRGECLVVAGESRALGAPTNPLVRIRDAKGVELVVQTDYRTRDPLLGFTAPADGEYVVEVQDVMNNYSNINADYVYRITLTTGPWLDSLFPLAAQRGVTTRIKFHGWNLGGRSGRTELDAEVTVPSDAPDRYTIAAGGAPNSLSLLTSTAPEEVEREPNGPSQPLALSAPFGISGTLAERGDRDGFSFSARKGETLLIDATARDLGSFADLSMTLRDASGKVLSTVDDAEGSRDPRLLWTAPADGVYTIVLRDLAGGSRGGPEFYYHLRVAPPAPELTVTGAQPTYVLKPGEKLEISLTVRQGYQPAELLLEAKGLPPGVTADPIKVESRPAAPGNTQVKLVLTASKELKPGRAPFRIIATAGSLVTEAKASWQLSEDRSGTLATGNTSWLMLAVPE